LSRTARGKTGWREGKFCLGKKRKKCICISHIEEGQKFKDDSKTSNTSSAQSEQKGEKILPGIAPLGNVIHGGERKSPPINGQGKEKGRYKQVSFLEVPRRKKKPF